MPSFSPTELACIAEANAKAEARGAADALHLARARLAAKAEPQDDWSVPPEQPEDWSAL